MLYPVIRIHCGSTRGRCCVLCLADVANTAVSDQVTNPRFSSPQQNAIQRKRHHFYFPCAAAVLGDGVTRRCVSWDDKGIETHEHEIEDDAEFIPYTISPPKPYRFRS